MPAAETRKRRKVKTIKRALGDSRGPRVARHPLKGLVRLTGPPPTGKTCLQYSLQSCYKPHHYSSLIWIFQQITTLQASDFATMDISQKDRDSLRAKQHSLNKTFCIGNIVEHKIQDPAKYKRLSRQEQGLSVDAQPELPKIDYKSKYLSLKQTISDATATSTNHADKDMQPLGKETSTLHSEPDAALLNDIQSNLWLNMDRVEFDKLEWMSEQADRAYQEKLKSTTHFDGEGRALAPSAATTVDRDNPAYDLESLIRLLDSTFQPQITYSLNVISKIATRATTGLYDSVFDENIHQLLLKECLLRVRRHIDSVNETICLAALRCLRSLICNTQVDEIFLDKMCPLKSDEFNATIWLTKDQDSFDIELKDNECVQIDAILALLTRTDLLRRLSYLLKTKVEPKFKQAYQDCILDLLIRLARHSRGSCWMLNSFDFPTLILNDFLPNNIASESSLTKSLALRSLKLLRILSYAAFELKTLAHGDKCLYIRLPEVLERRVTDYYHIDCYSLAFNRDDSLFKLHIETLRLMKRLMLLDKFPKHMFAAVTMDPALLMANLKVISKLDSTQIIEAPSSLDWQYAASLIDLIGHMVNYEKYHLKSHIMRLNWKNFIMPAAMRWWTDLVRNQLIPHQDVSIAIASAVQHFVSCDHDQLNDNIYTELLNGKEENSLAVTYYRKLISDAACISCLKDMLRTNGRLRDPEMLPSYGFLNLNTEKECSFSINRVAGIRTPFILLKVFIDSLQKDKSTRRETFKNPNNRNLILYLKDATRYYRDPTNFETSVQQSLLAQYEICLLAKSLVILMDDYLQSVPGEQDQPETTNRIEDRLDCYSNILLDTISIIGLINPQSEYMANLKDELIEKIILDSEIQLRLSRECYSSNHIQGLNEKLDIRHLNENLDSCLKVNHLDIDDLHILKPVYMNCDHSGRFWIFHPLVEYYKAQLRDDERSKREEGGWLSESTACGTSDHNDSEIIGPILRLNAALMQCSPAYVEIAVKPNIEEIICLVGLVFLDSDSFLNPVISQALKLNLQFMLSHCLGQDGLLFSDASRKIETLNLTLADFFDKLLVQYEASSYGDINFSNFLLLFISPRSDSMFKMKLFSEKLETCLSQMRITHDEVWIPPNVLDGCLEMNQEIRRLIKLSGPYLAETHFLKSYRNRCIAVWDDKM